MERVAALPVMNPAMAMVVVLPNMKVKPARAPVSSTSASLRPNTIELM